MVCDTFKDTAVYFSAAFIAADRAQLCVKHPNTNLLL